MKRRQFITLLGGAVAWPLPASAQQTPKLPTIGFLSPTTASVENQRVAAFVHRLRELGWIEGRTVAIKVRWAEGRSERAGEIVTQFVREKVDVIVLGGAVSVLAASSRVVPSGSRKRTIAVIIATPVRKIARAGTRAERPMVLGADQRWPVSIKT
jgi:putative ABC transport system substrate-binding protein